MEKNVIIPTPSQYKVTNQLTQGKSRGIIRWQKKKHRNQESQYNGWSYVFKPTIIGNPKLNSVLKWSLIWHSIQMTQ